MTSVTEYNSENDMDILYKVDIFPSNNQLKIYIKYENFSSIFLKIYGSVKIF